MFGTYQTIMGVLGQIRDLEVENERLRERYEKLQRRYEKLKRSNDDLNLVVEAWKDVAES